MQYLANLATSALLGLLVAVLAAVAASRTPALVGTPLAALAGSPLAALAAGRGNTGRATRRTAAGRTRRNGTGRDADKPTGRGNGATGTGRNGNGRNGNRTAPAARSRTADRAKPRVNAKSGIPRLGMGALRQQVLDYLQQHAREDLSPTQVANALGGRSSGAVGNALETLTKQGQVTKTSDAPRRFTVAAKRGNGRARKADTTPAAPTAAQTAKRQPGRTAKATANGTGRTSPTARKAPAKASGTGRNGTGARKGRRTSR